MPPRVSKKQMLLHVAYVFGQNIEHEVVGQGCHECSLFSICGTSMAALDILIIMDIFDTKILELLLGNEGNLFALDAVCHRARHVRIQSLTFTNLRA